MQKLYLQNFLSFLISALFLVSSTCNSGGQTKAVVAPETVDKDRLPTRRELRRAFRGNHNLTFIYPDNQVAADFYNVKIAAMNKNEDLNLKVKGAKASELTKEQLSNDIIFIVGKIEVDSLLMELQAQLPLQINQQSFSFDGKEYKEKNDLLKLFPYPNPYNQSLPLYFLIGNDNEIIQNFLQENYSDDLFQLLRWSWGYEIQHKSEVRVSGYFNEKTWELDKKTHFDFTGQNDTIISTGHFQFIAHSSPLSKEEITVIAQKCEENYTIINNFLEAQIDLPKIDYHFYPTVESKALQKSNMQEASADMNENRVDVVMNDNFQGSALHAENKLIFRKSLGKPSLLALEEGLSNRFTKAWQKKGYAYWTKKLFLSDNLPPLKELLDNEVYKKESYLVMGAMAGTFVDFLIAKFGKKEFLNKYKNWQSKDFSALESEWLIYLNKITTEDTTNTVQIKKPKLPYLKGFNFAHEGYRIYNGYGSQLAKESLERTVEIGANAIAIVPYSYMRDPENPSYIPIIQGTGGENDQAVLFSHYEAKKMGMSTMLKPQIWVGSNSWPGDIRMKNQKEWDTFFENYYRWVRHYAMLAEINEVNSYCIGVEFAKATLAKEEEWRKIIKKIRGIYRGQLTYAANWGDEFENVTFWDELDFIGLNCYYPLSKKENPSKKELTKAFDQVIHKIEKVCNKYDKPLVFTEIGFRSVDGPWKNPHAKEGDRPFNDVHQKLCYEVVLKGIQNKKWCNGILWWKWPSHLSHRGERNKGFSPNSKQTEDVINKYFKTKIN